MITINYTKEMVKLKAVQRKKGYPTRFLDKVISQFLNKTFKKEIMINTIPKKKLRLALPDICTKPLRWKTKINKLFMDQLSSANSEFFLRSTKKCHLDLDSKTRFSVLYFLV